MSERFWDIYAFCYDSISHLAPYREMLRIVSEELNLRPKMRVLDAGCGTGNFEKYLRNRGIECEIVGIDFSEGMLRRARNKCKDGSTEFCRADLVHPLPFLDGSFDRILCINVLYAVSNAQRVLDEFYRVLKKGGRLIVVDPREDAKFMQIFWEHFANTNLRERIFRFIELCNPLVLSRLITVGVLNFWIDRKYRKGELSYYSSLSWTRMLSCFHGIHISTTYSNQHWIIIADKKPGKNITSASFFVRLMVYCS